MNRTFVPLILLLAVTGSAADLQYVERSQMTGGAAARMTAMLGRLAKGVNEPITTTHSYSGNKKATVSAKSHEIWDLDKETITSINTEQKQYSVITFAEMAQLSAAMAERMAQQRPGAQPAPEAGTAKWKASFDKNGQTKQVAGVTANGGTMKLEMEGTDAKTGQTGSMKMDIDMWMGKIPGWEVKQAFDRRVGEKMGAQTGPQMAAFAQVGAAGMEAMKEAGKKMSELGEMQLASVTRMYSDSVPNLPAAAPESAGAALPAPPQQPATSGPTVAQVAQEEARREAENQALSRAGGKLGGLGGRLGGGLGGRLGQLGRNKQQSPQTPQAPAAQPAPEQASTAPVAASAGGPGLLMEMTSEVISYSSTVDPGAFDVPAGYKQVEHPMKKALGKYENK